MILLDVQYLQNVASSFEKSCNAQNHSSLGSHHLIKKSPQWRIPPSPSLKATWKTLGEIFKPKGETEMEVQYEGKLILHDFTISDGSSPNVFGGMC